jgi:hypothetical protein
VAHWYHLNTYVSLFIILGMLTAAIAFSLRRNRLALAQDAADRSAQDA